LASFYIKEPGNDLTVFALEARIGKLSEWKKLQGKQKTERLAQERKRRERFSVFR